MKEGRKWEESAPERERERERERTKGREARFARPSLIDLCNFVFIARPMLST